ncbi:MAG: undecaprenyl-phosphate glucose phosphotransferase [bacterium]|nr:undecaprenyl-phosphate glucose phosphotransferase [Gammaproteobacteria bacterium]HIL96317.1 undecaprenyl-phosphate glucose phosphotransferase [Pseudomonadales bacterium]
MPTYSAHPLFTHLSPFIAVLLDLTGIIVSAYLAYWLHHGSFSFANGEFTLVLIVSLLFILLCSVSDMYRSLPGTNALTLLLKFVLAWASTFAFLFGYLVFTKTSETFSRVWLAYWISGGFVILLILRFFSSLIVTVFYSNEANRQRILLIGHPDIAEKMLAEMNNMKSVGYTIAGFWNIRAEHQNPDLVGKDLRVENLSVSEYIAGHPVDEIWVCLPFSEEKYIEELVYELRHTAIDIRQVLRTPDLNLLAKNISEFGSVSTLDISCSPHHQGGKFFAKALEDYILGTLIFIAITPLLLIIAVLIKLTSSGPVLFKQYRDGAKGDRFEVYKFRSMEVHSESEGTITQATAEDPRVTRLGKFLRSSSLDELPQFYNVLQGRMSIVGPRPHALAHNEYYKELMDSYMRRHLVKPGITGWAQVNGFRGETQSLLTMEKRIKYDLFYIENWSIWLDLKIIFLTPIKLLQQRKTTY